jgi:hypothetical protein
MPRYSCNPTCFIDRPWWSGHPFRPHRGRCRKWVMSILLVLLCVVIGGYTYLTDAARVRLMAQNYLSQLLGGRVEIGAATLSLFEGLRLDNVSVHVDADRGQPDSLLFSAQSFVLNYDPRKLVEGQLEATEIIAQKPHVYLTLTQDGSKSRWNYQRLHPVQAAPAPAAKPGPVNITLPQILLRNAVVEISEVQAGQRSAVGSMDIDGQLTPATGGQRYDFEMQSRGVGEGLGPYANGTVAVGSGELVAHLRNVQFGEDIRSMFPADLRDWWARHDLGGRIESVDLTYSPARGRQAAKFSVQTAVKGITLSVNREEWSSREEIQHWRDIRSAVSMLGSVYRIAGYPEIDSCADPKAPGPDASRTPAPITSPAQPLAEMCNTAPLRLREVTGSFLFDQDGIDVNDLLVRVGTGDAKRPDATNAFRIRGHVEGYRADAPLRLQVSSADPEGLYIPARPRFLDSLPRDVRNFYSDLRPEGTCRLSADVNRPIPGAVPQVNVQVEIVDASFQFHQFPYPFRGASGRIAYGRDPFSEKNFVNVVNMHGSGMLGGPNQGSQVAISGRVGPLGPDNPEPGFNLRATGDNICSEPALIAAMPWQVRDALKVFDAPHKGEFPQFKASFITTIHREPGPLKRTTFDTDVTLQDAAGRIVGFPYPCRHASGKVEVRDGYVNVVDVRMHDGASMAQVTGTVKWADSTGRDLPLDMNLHIKVHGLPVNDDLTSSMPPEQSQWIRKLGIGGNLDVEGRIFTVVPEDWQQHVQPHHKPKDPPILYDLAIGIHDGTLWPADGMFSVSAVAGNLHLTRDRLEVIDVHGTRGGGEIAATGAFTFTGPVPRMALHVAAKNLATDRPLYALLPPDGRRAWDEVRPDGTVDAEVDYHGPLGSQPSAALASAAPSLELLPAAEVAGFCAVVHPRKLAVLVRTAPYPLTFTSGSVTISSGKAVLQELVGTHGNAKLTVSGEGSLASTAPAWELQVRATDLPADDDLRKAIPPMLRDILNGLKLGGTLGFDFSRLSYRASATPGVDPDVDVAGSLSLKDGSMDAGVTLADVVGGMKFSATTRQGKLDTLAGAVAFDSLKLGGRPIRDLKLDLVRESGSTDLHINQLRARVAGGELGGRAMLSFPDSGVNRYTMNLVVRDADVRELTGEADQEIRGALTASLSLEGKWDDPSARRGRGDVVVAGKQLYHIPLMLGLLQVTNLSLPIGGPFTKGTARYTVEGARVNFEQMDLRADTMTMTGSGYLDFGTKQVRMTLCTNNAVGLKVPFLSDLWQGARQELLRINVQGTVQDPKVQPTSLGTFTTTVDQVFSGDSSKK